MADQNKPFVVTDRRKFTLDGELRPDADPSPAREPRPETLQTEPPPPPAPIEEAESPDEMPAGPAPEQIEQARAAYQATSDRLDTAIRAANPGMDHPPAMACDQIVQSVYMSAIMQLGGNTPQGQQPQVDLMGARQSIDMLAILQEKTKGNLAADETRLLENALFELRIAFLEITQSLARSASAKSGQPRSAGPSIVR